eukprot:11179069-Lingulodinium_polyedra.AAC.1
MQANAGRKACARAYASPASARRAQSELGMHAPRRASSGAWRSSRSHTWHIAPSWAPAWSHGWPPGHPPGAANAGSPGAIGCLSLGQNIGETAQGLGGKHWAMPSPLPDRHTPTT